MSACVLVMANGIHIRVDETYGAVKKAVGKFDRLELHTRGTFPGDPLVTVACDHVAFLLPAGDS